MTGRFIRKTFVEYQREFVEHLQIGKQIGKLLDMPKRPQAQKTHFIRYVVFQKHKGAKGPGPGQLRS